MGEAATVDEAVEVIARKLPEAVLLEVHMPGGDGGGATGVRRRLAESPETRSVRSLALSVADVVDDVVSVIRAGARGYLTKTATGSEMTESVLRVRGDDAVFSPRLAGFVLDAFGAGTVSVTKRCAADQLHPGNQR